VSGTGGSGLLRLTILSLDDVGFGAIADFAALPDSKSGAASDLTDRRRLRNGLVCPATLSHN
jgi:hypothetical protein